MCRQSSRAELPWQAWAMRKTWDRVAWSWSTSQFVSFCAKSVRGIRSEERGLNVDFLTCSFDDFVHDAVHPTLRPLSLESQHSGPRSSQPSAAAPLGPERCYAPPHESRRNRRSCQQVAAG